MRWRELLLLLGVVVVTVAAAVVLDGGDPVRPGPPSPRLPTASGSTTPKARSESVPAAQAAPPDSAPPSAGTNGSAAGTCEDVTTYDYNWDNDMKCTRSDGSIFYTDYDGAERFERYGDDFP